MMLLAQERTERTGRGGARVGAGRKPKPVRASLPAPVDLGPRWYCVRAEPRQESLARDEIAALGFTVFLPRFVRYAKGKPLRTTDGALVTGPLFGPYLFPRFDRLDWTWRRIVSARGVRRLISSSPEWPTPVPDSVIERLLAKADAEGIIDEGDPTPAVEAVPVDARVRLTSGAFAAWEGICQHSTPERVRLLLEVMGAHREVTVSRNQVEII